MDKILVLKYNCEVRALHTVAISNTIYSSSGNYIFLNRSPNHRSRLVSTGITLQC
jgi:hypothetical protein